MWTTAQRPPIDSTVAATEQRRIGRIFMWSSIGEGVGIFVIIKILANVGMADRYMSGMALAVGIHFIPIALGIPYRPYIWLASMMIVLAGIGLVIPSPQLAALFVGCGAAMLQWLTAFQGISKVVN